MKSLDQVIFRVFSSSDTPRVYEITPFLLPTSGEYKPIIFNYKAEDVSSTPKPGNNLLPDLENLYVLSTIALSFK